MLDKVKNTIKKFNMLENGDTVIVGVSGGVDSAVLLHLLKRLAPEYKLPLIVAHLNHSLRGKESERDAAFVKKLAREAKIGFVGKKIDVKSLLKKGDSMQDIAREARYDFFEEVAKRHKAQRIATGHNLDDQAETVIMRFLKGASRRGLSGIPPARGKYIRPLIEISRKEIEGYAAMEGLQFVKDSSNKSAKYLRNRVRLKLMPMLAAYNPAIKSDMARLSHIFRRDEEYLKDKAEDACKDVVIKQDKKAVSLSLEKLIGLHDAIKVRILFMVIEELLGSSKGFYSCHAEDFLKLLSSHSPNAVVTLPRNLSVCKEYGVITIEKSRKKEKYLFLEKTLKINGKTGIVTDNGRKIAEFDAKVINHNSGFHIPHPASRNAAYFDYNKLKIPLLVRNFRPGDCFAPFGMKGHKKLKDLFIEKKIPKRNRGLVPILVSGDEIIWVVGLRQASYGKIGPQTKKILKIDFVHFQ